MGKSRDPPTLHAENLPMFDFPQVLFVLSAPTAASTQPPKYSRKYLTTFVCNEHTLEISSCGKGKLERKEVNLAKSSIYFFFWGGGQFVNGKNGDGHRTVLNLDYFFIANIPLRLIVVGGGGLRAML